MHLDNPVMGSKGMTGCASIMRKNWMQLRFVITDGVRIDLRSGRLPRFLSLRHNHLHSFRPRLCLDVSKLRPGQKRSTCAEFQPGYPYVFSIDRQFDATLLFVDEILKVNIFSRYKRGFKG